MYTKLALLTVALAGAASASPFLHFRDDTSQYLDPQNSLRAQKGAVAFTWNQTLADYAKKVSNTCVFKHSGGPYGENLAAGSGNFPISSGIKAWTDEESSYDPNNPQPSHYTQVVWKGSKQLGCAETTCAPGTIFDPKFGVSPGLRVLNKMLMSFDSQTANYIVCEYFPAGNVIGEFP
jgi:pathogenesis-related protein 1